MKQLKISICCMLVVLMVSLQAIAQQKIIDSLQIALAQAKEDTNKVNLLNLLSKYAGWRIDNYDTAFYFAKEANILARKLSFKKGIGNSYINWGKVDLAKGNYPSAFQNFHKALNEFDDSGDKKGIANSYYEIGRIYWNQRNYQEALNNYYLSLEIFEKLKDKSEIPNPHSGIGEINLQLGNYSEAIRNFTNALKGYKETNDDNGIATYYSNMGDVNYIQHNYTTALENYLISIEIYKKVGNKYGIVYTNTKIGKTYIKQGRVHEGKKWLIKNIALSKEIGGIDVIMESYRELAVADSILKNFESVFENYKLFITYRDSLTNEEDVRRVTKTALQYDFDKRKAIMEAKQDKEKALSKEALRRKDFQKNTFLAALIITLLIASLFFRQRNRINKEKKRSDKLLLNILPAEVADELKTKGTAAAKQFDDVTVLFTDFVNFTQTSEHLSPQQLVQELNACFTAFDEITERNGLEKIKTVGDAYIAVCGLPLSDPLHAQKAVKAALEIRNFIEERKKTQNVFEIRIGVNSGSVVAGIVGVKKFAYDIWGDTVNTAARMESNGQPGKVNISETTYRLVKDDFTCTHRGKISAKGKGEVDMYFVE